MNMDYMIEIVKTMEDKDIIEFIKNYEGFLSAENISELMIGINDKEVLSKYVKYVSDNIDVAILKWYDVPDNDVNFEEDNFLNSYSNVDSFIKKYGDSSFGKDIIEDIMEQVGNEDINFYVENIKELSASFHIIYILMTIVNKIDDNNLKINLLHLLFNNIKPAIISCVGEKAFNVIRKVFLEDFLVCVANKLKVDEIIQFLKSNKEILSDTEYQLFMSAIDKKSFKDEDGNIISYSEISQSELKENVLECVNDFENYRFNYINNEDDMSNYFDDILFNILNMCSYISDNVFLEYILNSVYDRFGILLTDFIENISDDNLKIDLFIENNMAGVLGYIDVLSSIKDYELFKKLYDDLDNGFVHGFAGFSNKDRVDLICARKDKMLAYKMLSELHDMIKKNSNNYVELKELINQLCMLISIFDKEEQIEIYNLFSELLCEDYRVLLISKLKDNDFKRGFLLDIEKRELNNYTLSKKKYN